MRHLCFSRFDNVAQFSGLLVLLPSGSGDCEGWSSPRALILFCRFHVFFWDGERECQSAGLFGFAKEVTGLWRGVRLSFGKAGC